jgi:hypothetical protein
MLCEHCGKNFAREGNFKKHVCKKNKKNEDNTTTSFPEVETDILEDISETRQEEEENMSFHSSPSSSSEEETRPRPVKRVTFKEKEKKTSVVVDTPDLKHILTGIALKVDRLTERLGSIDTRFSSLEKQITSTIDTRFSSLEKQITSTSFSSLEKQHESSSIILDELSKVKNELLSLFNSKPDYTEEQTPKKESPIEEEVVTTNECCLVIATNEDRLKRKLFKICLIENWKEQQDKVNNTYHLIMEKTFEDKEEGNKMLGKIENDFSKRRVSANKKWYKLRDDDIEGLIELFN